MPEHQIKLRGAWQWKYRTESDADFRRVNLPTIWPTDLESPIRLIRPFGRPAIDPRTEGVRLELHDVPGLVSARLNGLDVVPVRGELADWVVELNQPLPARNELILDVDLRSAEEAAIGKSWGAIALVIAPKQTTPIN